MINDITEKRLRKFLEIEASIPTEGVLYNTALTDYSKGVVNGRVGTSEVCLDILDSKCNIESFGTIVGVDCGKSEDDEVSFTFKKLDGEWHLNIQNPEDLKTYFEIQESVHGKDDDEELLDEVSLDFVRQGS